MPQQHLMSYRGGGDDDDDDNEIGTKPTTATQSPTLHVTWPYARASGLGRGQYMTWLQDRDTF